MISDILPEVLSTVRHRLNACMSPINKSLPPEILLKVFGFVPSMPRLISKDLDVVCGPMGFRKVWELRPVTQVCHHWRELAINTSSLWSSAFRLPFRDSFTNQIMRPTPETSIYPYIHRRTNGPVYLYVEEFMSQEMGWHATTPLESPTGLGYEPFVEELHVVPWGNWTGAVPPILLEKPMPALKRMILHDRNVDADQQHPGLAFFFDGQPLTALTSLASFCMPFLPLNSMPVLTRLVLFYRRLSTAMQMDDFIQFLSGAPALREAYLHHIPYHPSIADVGSRGDRGVVLGQLCKLSVSMWDCESQRLVSPVVLLQQLRIPPTCLLRIDTLCSPYCIDAVVAYLKVGQWDLEDEYHAHCVYGIGAGTLSSIQVTSSSRGIRIDFQGSTEDHVSPEGAFQALLLTPPFALAHALWLSGWGLDYATTSGASWSSPLCLSTLPNVRELYIASPQGCTVPMQLITSLGTGENDAGEPHLPFPAMTTLYAFVYDRPELELVADVARQRAAAERPLRRLLVGCERPGYPYSRPLRDWAEIAEVAGPHVRGPVEVLGEDGYEARCAVRHVLPPACTREGGGVFSLWPAWTENEAAPVPMM